MTSPETDPRLDRVLSMITAFASGDFAATVAPSGKADELDAIIIGLSMLGEELAENVRRLQATHDQLLQAEKLAGIGQLAGGFAHEINNPLSVIYGFAQLLQASVPEGDPLRVPVTSIARESQRCTALVRELLTFSRTAEPGTQAVDLNTVVRASALMLEARAKTLRMSVVQELADGLPAIRANRTQVEQVIMNLGMNGLDAMRPGGAVTLRTIGEPDGVRLEVADTGAGIPEALRSRVFEPFFTTKEVGKGTGLGLSIVREIVRRHSGAIDVASEPGRGTTMKVRWRCGP
ncbi:MAG: hypothetical protein HY906_01895 [Deltaproteobacteria bacterium]|nr:hypothetical protein [Deltaproteobacteria bacterium]